MSQSSRLSRDGHAQGAARRPLSWWVWSLCLGLGLAVLTWLLLAASSAAGSSSGPMLVVGGFLVGAAVGFATAYVWCYPEELLDTLHGRIADLEEMRSIQPSPSVRFEYDRTGQHVRLHVTNHGGAADFTAPMTIDGALSTPVDYPVFATWEHTSRVSSTIQQGETRSLQLASLDVSTFPYAQWRVSVVGEGRGAAEIPALHTSMVGGLLDTQAPRLLLHVSLMSTPAAPGDPPMRVVALDPFGAELLTR